ncbi:3-oxoacyl-[acyl-carrier protein] reductase [Streptomyces zhaozhouensis]|uniref:3-oxoacyl-[acyl-carrier protein] reductase n=1 Tax=Streptomyces zhaozhouensis TaxID=1300267 RepID=A0A286E1N1_9ACTN|nr:SDR family oxidoreductase [Streptomyces zhaozhouensis]SOD64816.1 3-oxoacyl-[acyl-carrier protein] reductase [Streptomyces zhaozhouensis]
MDLGLSDRVYVVTGGTRGLGRATAEALVAEGARVVVASRGAEAVAGAVAGLGEENAAGLAADLAAPETPERLLALAGERFGRCDGALISVGGPPPGTAAAVTDAQWRSAFESVFLGAVRAARTFAGALAEGEGGALGLVLSSSARSPINGLGISNGLRPGLAMVAKDMSDEFGPRGVRVLGLLPGRIATDRTRELDAAADPEARRRTKGAIPLGRYGEPAEFGRVAAFLLSPAAGYVTGTTVPVDGGALRTP